MATRRRGCRRGSVKAGMRPISNVVDVTNYVLLEPATPLHAFDLASLARREDRRPPRAAGRGAARPSTATQRKLDAADLLIADAERASPSPGSWVAATPRCDDTTTSILLEAAYFEPIGIARSSKRLKLRRELEPLERGIDPRRAVASAALAMELFVEVAGARGPGCTDVPTSTPSRPVDHAAPRPSKR